MHQVRQLYKALECAGFKLALGRDRSKNPTHNSPTLSLLETSEVINCLQVPPLIDHQTLPAMPGFCQYGANSSIRSSNSAFSLGLRGAQQKYVPGHPSIHSLFQRLALNNAIG